MNWSDHLTRIRRWVRDPNGDIFEDAFLLRLFNDELQQMFGPLGPVSDVQVVRIPPAFQMSYHYDWEWAYSGHASGEVYQLGGYYDADDYVYLQAWEPEHLKDYTATSYTPGDVYAHPWEAWAVTTPHHSPPVPLPIDDESVLFLAHDKERIDPETKSDLMRADDTTWKTRAGSALSYWRDEKNSRWIYIYPIPTISWQDTEDAGGDPDEAEYGGTTVDVDNNLLAVYRIEPTEITATTDETELPYYLQKYVEYGTASRALRANTDGRIESLADYWELRKKAGYEVIKKWNRQKLSAWRIRLATREGSPGSSRPKYPRLPSSYPDEVV